MWNVEVWFWLESSWRVPGGLKRGFSYSRDEALRIARGYLGGDAQGVRIINAHGSFEELKRGPVT